MKLNGGLVLAARVTHAGKERRKQLRARPLAGSSQQLPKLVELRLLRFGVVRPFRSTGTMSLLIGESCTYRGRGEKRRGACCWRLEAGTLQKGVDCISMEGMRQTHDIIIEQLH